MFQSSVTESKCRLCPSEVHVIRKYPKFLNMSSNQRLAEIRRYNLRLNFFSKTHTIKNYNSKFSCYKCKKRHNTLLHGEQESNTPSTNIHSDSNSSPSPSTYQQSSLQSTSPGNAAIQTCFSSRSNGVLLGIASVKICNNGLTYVVRALVDSGS